MIGADVVFKQWISCSSSIGGGSGVVTPTAMPKPSLEPKCSHSHDETRIAANNSNTKNVLLPLPPIGDVLTVNLLRLLEGAAAIRLHHLQQQPVSSPSSFSNSSICCTG
mmetsp:Transcript_11946/g.20970  ORF Transcript_11946/g.20970 Transcript_11946/m.20970 type:complete len:109 (+) Transcript_11946:284-610(+)